jgi:hypothetical protein
MENEYRAEQTLKQLELIGAKVFFEKQLTSSDVSASGRVVVPKVWNLLSCAAVPWAPLMLGCTFNVV